MTRKSGIYDDLFKTVCGYPKVVGSIGKFFSSVQFIKKLISGDTGIAMVESNICNNFIAFVVVLRPNDTGISP